MRTIDVAHRPRGYEALIREGVDLVTGDSRERVFHSMGIERSSGSPSQDLDGTLVALLDDRLARDRRPNDAGGPQG
jgi:hypothetical protein